MKEKKYLALIIMLAFTCVVSGQIVPPPAPPPPPPGLPINGGLIFLIISGIFYGVKKVRD
ncbi:PID-CTERM protein-sorting domain-containing protein [Polaribacter sp. Z022]|uniref:PID-CTERM protein-sorting domain-containing protein n=1 Tax=Polaribacter sp. Z022 TaxID=2927125 RepID=UPI0020214EDA|nr:hypothetical protein [Polaribacter sp. Z022]MCL7754572.1 hypothetical protein [Polaribacter sp. Z022]